MPEDKTHLKVGDEAPDFCLPDKDNQDVYLKDFRGKKHVILYFYPMDNTPGCTTQAIGFTNILPEFQKLYATVIDVSPNSPKSHIRFSEKKNLKVILLSDQEKKVIINMEYGGNSRLKKKSLRVLFEVLFLSILTGRSYIFGQK